MYPVKHQLWMHFLHLLHSSSYSNVVPLPSLQYACLNIPSSSALPVHLLNNATARSIFLSSHITACPELRTGYKMLSSSKAIGQNLLFFSSFLSLRKSTNLGFSSKLVRAWATFYALKCQQNLPTATEEDALKKYFLFKTSFKGSEV